MNHTIRKNKNDHDYHIQRCGKSQAKFKLLRKNLKRWSKSISHINNITRESNNALEVIDKLEELRTLHVQKKNFGTILKTHILRLQKAKNNYWRKR